MNPRLPDDPTPPDENSAFGRAYMAVCVACFVATLVLSWWRPWGWFGVAP